MNATGDAGEGTRQITVALLMSMMACPCSYTLERRGGGTSGRVHRVKSMVHIVKMSIAALQGSRIRAFVGLQAGIRESRAVGRKRDVGEKGLLLSKGLPERFILRWPAREE